MDNLARSNLLELPNTTFTIIIHWVLNGKDIVQAAKQLQASDPDVRHWEELVDFIDKNGGLKEPFILTSISKCAMEQGHIEVEYMGL
jgi:hypothetical protein